MTTGGREIGPVHVYYLSRGSDKNSIQKAQAFASSYRAHPAGLDHKLFVIFKGFNDGARLAEARSALSDADGFIYATDDAFDLGAYADAASQTDGETLCFLNTSSIIRSSGWLGKLGANFALPNVGIAGCTGSYEAPQHPDLQNPAFPNPHLRSNAIMIERMTYLSLWGARRLATKTDAHAFEHGVHGMTRRLLEQGLQALLIGANGRGYEPEWWPHSATFRQGLQQNLMVSDNQTLTYERAPLPEKRVLFSLAWGDSSLRVPLNFGFPI